MRSAAIRAVRVVAWVILLLAGALAPAGAEIRDVLAEGAGDRLWVAEVIVPDGAAPGGAQAGTERTRVHLDIVLGGDVWQRSTMIGAGTRDLANRGTQLVALLKTGELMFVWQEGKSTASALPAAGEMAAVGSDGTTVWAVGRVPGGMQSIPARPATGPATQEGEDAAATRAAIVPAVTTAPAEAGPPRLVLFRLERSTWVAEGELPEAIPADVRGLSMAVVRGRVTISVVQEGEAAIFEADGDGGWQEVGRLKPAGVQVIRAKVLDGKDGPILWVAGATGAGVFYFGNGQQQTQWSKPVELRVAHDLSQPLARDVAVVAQRVRLVFAKGDKLFMQNFDRRTGEPQGEVRPITPAAGSDGRSGFWINAAVMGVLLMVMVGAMRRRGEMEETVRRLDRIPLAPLGLRLAAGLVDLWPYWLAGAYLSMRPDASQGLASVPDELTVRMVMIAIGVYIAHTMLLEMLFGASVGKILFGLRVVLLNGERPGTGAFFVRNIMRAIDAGLVFVGAVMILMTPLRQRIGDLAAGTIVVRRTAQVEGASEEAVGEEAAESSEK